MQWHSLNVANDIVGETPQYQERGSSDACAVAHEHPQSEGGCHSISLNAGKGFVGETPRHQASDVGTVANNSPGDEFESINSAPDAGNNISSCFEHAKVDKAYHLVGPDGPPSLRSSVLF